MEYNSQNNNRRFGKLKFILLFMVLSGLMALLNHVILSHTDNNEETMADTSPEDDVPSADTTFTDTIFQIVKKNNVEGVRSFIDDFPDQNDVQLDAAQKNGVIPLDSRSQIDNYIQTGRLVYVGNSPYFHLDDLTHSIPYLTPKAYHLVNTICINFLDSLQSKGMQPHIPIVTSVLRTLEDITSLRRGNRNSVERSAHRYGTTVDITYNRFMPLQADGTLSYEPTRYNFQQKLVLSEVLRDLRLQGLCYVKYERRQACFHLTVR